MRSTVGLWGPVAAVMLAIFMLSSQPTLPDVGVDDKSSHRLAYAVLSSLIYRAVAKGRVSGLTTGRASLAAFSASAYGASDEWHQSFVPGRTSEGADLIADAFGACAAAIALRLWGILASRRAIH